jgi:hypothetical protein
MASIILEAQGFRFSLEAPTEPNLEEPGPYFVGAVALVSLAGAPTHVFRTAARFPLSNLGLLCDLVDRHIGVLLQSRSRPIGSAPESPVWMPLDLSMEVQLLSGEIDLTDGRLAGSFTMVVLLTIGTDPRSGHRIRGGFQAAVLVEEALAFCAAVRQYSTGSGRPGAGA